MPNNISVSLTNRCNLRCRMCGSQNMEHQPEIKYLTRKNWEYLCKKIPSGWNLEINACGEHSLHPEFHDFIEHIATTRAGEVSIKWSTNGMWPWNDEQTNRLLNWLSALNTVQGWNSEIIFSIDGFNRETIERIRCGIVYNRLMHNVHLCLNSGHDNVEVGVAFVAMKNNISEAALLAKSLPGLKHFYLNILNVCTEEMIPESLIDLKANYVRAGEGVKKACLENETLPIVLHPLSEPISMMQGCNFPFYLWVNIEGDVHPCCRRWDKKISHISRPWEEILRDGRKAIGSFITDTACDLCFTEQDVWDWKTHFSSEHMHQLYKDSKKGMNHL